MSQTVTVTGLIIRTVDYKESDRLVSIFTDEMGLVSAMARGARSMRSRYLSSTMQFCYGRFVLYKKGDLYWIRETELLESFFKLRDSIDKLALASYLCDVLGFVTVEEAEHDLLRLALNSLYAIAEGLYSTDHIKAVFELRTAAILGFMPDVVSCRSCGEGEGDFVLDVLDGTVVCAECRAHLPSTYETVVNGQSRPIVLLTPGVREAFAYSIFSPLERIFSFSLSAEDMHLFARGAEEYIINHLERSFKTLDFYKEVKR